MKKKYVILHARQLPKKVSGIFYEKNSVDPRLHPASGADHDGDGRCLCVCARQRRGCLCGRHGGQRRKQRRDPCRSRGNSAEGAEPAAKRRHGRRLGRDRTHGGIQSRSRERRGALYLRIRRHGLPQKRRQAVGRRQYGIFQRHLFRQHRSCHHKEHTYLLRQVPQLRLRRRCQLHAGCDCNDLPLSHYPRGRQYPRHTGRSKLRCGFHADHRGRHVAQLLRRQPPHGCLAGARQGLRRQLYPH